MLEIRPNSNIEQVDSSTIFLNLELSLSPIWLQEGSSQNPPTLEMVAEQSSQTPMVAEQSSQTPPPPPPVMMVEHSSPPTRLSLPPQAMAKQSSPTNGSTSQLPPPPPQRRNWWRRNSARRAGPPPPRRNSAGIRRRSNAAEDEEDEMINPPPFQWATNYPTKIHSYHHLVTNGIRIINGDVQCKRCEHICQIQFDLEQKFTEIGHYIVQNKYIMCDRALNHWINPQLQACPSCNQDNCLKPIFPSDKKLINWLFLLLGEMIGICTLDQLKYYCDKNIVHRTGAKDRLIYLTYLHISKQLDPNGPFDYP